MCKISSVLVKKWRHNDTINFFSLQYLGILTFRHCDVKMTPYTKIFLWTWIQGLKITISAKFELDQVIILKIIVFSMPKMTWNTVNKGLLWQHLIRMVIDKICKMIVKGVKSNSKSFFSISLGVLELWRKTLKGADSAPPPPPRPSRVNTNQTHLASHCFLGLCHYVNLFLFSINLLFVKRTVLKEINKLNNMNSAHSST